MTKANTEGKPMSDKTQLVLLAIIALLIFSLGAGVGWYVALTKLAGLCL